MPGRVPPKAGQPSSAAQPLVKLSFGLRIWLGQSGSRPAHASVRGRLVDGTARTSGVTLSMALLGAVAATARWFGTHVLELTAMDNGAPKAHRSL